jgi:hypothetical protein
MLWLCEDQASESGEAFMIIVGCDFHPSWQQVMIFDSDTGEISERKLAGGPPLRFLQRWGPGMFDGHRLRRSVLLNSSVPTRLKRYYQTRHLHFITCSCYHRQPWLASAGGRDLFLRVLEQVRQRFIVVVGYLAMPEHIHLLISEPEKADPSKVMQALK